MRSSRSTGSARSSKIGPRGRTYSIGSVGSLRGGATNEELAKMTNAQLDQRLNTLVCTQQSTIANAGNGLFFTRNIPKNTILGYYKGRGYPDNTPAEKARNNQLNQNYIYVATYSLKGKKYVIDASNLATSNALRYANDPRDVDLVNIEFYEPGKRLTGAEITAFNQEGYPRAYIKTTRDVFIGEEAFLEYGRDWWDDYERRAVDDYLGAMMRPPTPEPKRKKQGRKRSKKRQSPQPEEEDELPRSIKTKGYVSIPTYANRKTVPQGCPAWEDLCTQDNMYMVKEKVRETAAEREERERLGIAPEKQCKCLVYQNGDPTACSHRPKGSGCNLPLPIDSDETRIRNSTGEPYYTYAKDLRMTFIDLEREGKPTVPACGCYKDDIHKNQMKERKRLQRERDLNNPGRERLPKYARGGGRQGQDQGFQADGEFL